MVRFFRIWIWIVFIGKGALFAGEPDVVYLTWTDDPTSTMTVVWHGGDASRVLFHAPGESKWMSTEAKVHQVAGTAVQVHTAYIQGLKSNSTYVFKIEGSRREYRFRTMPPKLSREIRFVVGGDIFYYWGAEIFQRMNRAIAFEDPDFVILGGDIAYTTGSKRSLKGRKWEIERWQEFLREMQKTMHAKEGRLIPMLVVVGNHDVHKMAGERKTPEIFYEIFPFPTPGKAYYKVEFGNYLSFVLLDTGHTWPIEGQQTEWLRGTLSNDTAFYRFVTYHVGAYPSVYKYKGHLPELIRKNWVPLFDEAGIPLVFEHHSHALKRTFPLKGGKVDPKGVVYLGDGSWGVPPRKVKTPQELWYLEKSAAVNACWFVKMNKKEAVIEARNNAGEVLDRLTISPRE